jgi:signal transduction histidine kinase/GTPase SAR1 family protein
MNQTDTGRNQIHARIVYWGPAGAGKTACLAALGPRLDPEEGFPLYSLAAADGSTYHFDLLPLEEFRFGGHRLRIRVIAVPGAAERANERVALLRGADAIVFVADPQRAARHANVRSWKELEETLLARGVDPGQIPIVIAFNKQDLADTVTLDEFRGTLGIGNIPAYETVATDGRGVFEAFSDVFQRLMGVLTRRHALEDVDLERAVPARLLPQLVRSARVSRRSQAGERHVVIQVPAGVPKAEQAIHAQLAMAEANIKVAATNHILGGRNRELMAANRVARSILSAMEADNLLVVLLDATTEHLNSSHATCVLFDPTDEGALRSHVLGFGRDPALGLQGEHAERFFELIKTSDGPVPLQQEYNVDLLQAVQQVDRRITRAMFQPIKAQDDKPAGWIGIYGTRDEPQLSTTAMLFLSSIARLAALGLEKIGLLDKIQRFNASLEDAVQERTGQLEMANAKIRALNRGLEARVKERTKALEEANRQLKGARAGSEHTARLRGIGHVAAAFAREVDSPVTGLSAHLLQMRESLDELRANVAPEASESIGAIDAFEEILDESVDSAQRISDIVASLKRLGGDAEPEETFSLNAIVADAAMLLEERIQASADLELGLGALPEIAGDHQEMSHVVLGLMTNAIEAIERAGTGERGRISISTFRTGGKIMLTVQDDGCGIDPEILPRVFEPYTTTKSDPNAGLGLHAAYQAAEHHGGTARIRSKPGEGTTVTLVLPATAKVEQEEEEEEAKA